MSNRWSIPSIPVAIVGAVALAGCTTRTQVFDGYRNDQLWTAMVATARSPDYDDWKVIENETYLDTGGRRIEVYRYLKRTLVSPYDDPRREDREWRFEILLTRDEELGAPVVEFTARQITVPAHVWIEADRYFMQVRNLLGPATGGAAAGPAAPADAARPSSPQAATPTSPAAASTPAATNTPPAGQNPDPALEPLPER